MGGYLHKACGILSGASEPTAAHRDAGYGAGSDAGTGGVQRTRGDQRRVSLQRHHHTANHVLQLSQSIGVRLVERTDEQTDRQTDRHQADRQADAQRQTDGCG